MKKIPRVDKVILIPFIALIIIGIFMVYSASNVVAKFKYNDAFYFSNRQIIYLLIGIIISIVIIKVDLIKYKKYSPHFFIVILALLLIVLIPGIGIVRGGARSWLGFGSFTIQPSEFMKIAIIFLLAKYLSDNEKELKKFGYFILIIILPLLVFGIIMLQPDFGTGIVIVISSFALIFVSHAKVKYFFLLLGVCIFGFIGLIIIAPYRLERIMAFLDPWEDPLGSGFQAIQALFAIAPSGIFGLGYNNSMQKHFFLPEPQNDFIFAIVCEELGLIGGLIVIGLFLIIIIRAIKYSIILENKFLKYLALGIGIALFTQTFINIGVVIGLLPVTGITLPLISYGGTSLITSMAEISILLNISKEVDI